MIVNKGRGCITIYLRLFIVIIITRTDSLLLSSSSSREILSNVSLYEEEYRPVRLSCRLQGQSLVAWRVNLHQNRIYQFSMIISLR